MKGMIVFLGTLIVCAIVQYLVTTKLIIAPHKDKAPVTELPGLKAPAPELPVVMEMPAGWVLQKNGTKYRIRDLKDPSNPVRLMRLSYGNPLGQVEELFDDPGDAIRDAIEYQDLLALDRARKEMEANLKNESNWVNVVPMMGIRTQKTTKATVWN